MRKSAWLLSASLIALPSAAFAQDTSQTPPPGTEPSPTEQAATEPESQAVADAEPGEIIVTAQGRRQVLQDVPIAVTAVGADEMQNSGATDIRQLNQLAPSLLVSSTGSEANGSARIRGIGTVGDNPGLESSVAVFIDGVYRSRSGIGLNELGEIDRVEVLRGPQGTLFGRNSSAGLINIISKRPSYTFEGYGEATIGNYDLRRLAGGVTGGLSDTVAARLDAVYVKRDGFYYDPENDTSVNDRDRFFTRGQLLFEPTDQLSIRLIGDYTTRDEKCCGAIYVDNSVNSNIGNLNELAVPLLQPGATPARTNDSGNNIVNVLRDLGQDLNALHQGYDRTLSVTDGRGYDGETKDWGLSGQVDYDFGGAKLTSITAYRNYDSSQAGDLDYGTVDILYRTEAGGREFKTFSQELRLQGEAFADRLDWLVGAYYADEDLTVTDDIKFGNQYGRFATCRIVSPGGFSPFYSPTGAACLNATGRGALGTPLGPFGPAGPLLLAAMDNLDSINNRGSTLDVYNQNSRNWALFTHNIFHVTPQVDLTVGLRYTNERKKFDATFGNNNTACVTNQALVGPFANPTSPFFAGANTVYTVAEAVLRLSCQGNSTAELDGVSIEDSRKESKLTGTGVLSYKPNDDLLLYASYSRGYKAGGFNLDRSALKNPTATFASFGGGNRAAGAQALVGNLQFDPETVDAFELGGKYSRRGFIFNFALFRQQFKNFQLNTFDGTVFIVQNINGCGTDLGAGDTDQSVNPGASNFIPPVIAAGSAFNLNPAAQTGRCDEDEVGWGVSSTGVELEATFLPMRDLRLNLGFTYAETKYRENLVGRDDGTPLNPALRMLPGNNISNAPEIVATGSLAWTPPIGGSGMTGLFYVDARSTSDYNTGSDLFPQKEQEGYTIVNGRVGIRGPEERWAIELWAQNLFNKDYAQVAFNSPFQAGGSTTPPWAPGFTFAPFTDPQYPGGRQLFSQFLAEPRTYGLTLRARFGGRRSMPVVAAPVAPPPPPPEPVVEQPAPPPPPPPPPPEPSGERG
ncbi:MAG TPA: TonB-dependent receptor [Sphingomicrobium sp.]|nr:TonB-dependent receptor [Sphingomicrobium sp.]